MLNKYCKRDRRSKKDVENRIVLLIRILRNKIHTGRIGFTANKKEYAGSKSTTALAVRRFDYRFQQNMNDAGHAVSWE